MTVNDLQRRRTINWRAVGLAGIIAGIVFMMLEMIMVPLFAGGSPWGPPRMIGAIVLGKGVLPPPSTFNIGVLMTAVVAHLILSVVYTAIVAEIINYLGTDRARSVLVGALFGLALYVVNFYGFTALFPWFAMARTWITVFTHIVFGLAAVAAYEMLEHPEVLNPQTA